MMSKKPAKANDRRAAQDLAYQAMEARSREEALSLCAQAIALDPRCVDALMILGVEIGSTDGRLKHIKHVAEIALEDLGGESYLEENRGYFWGLLETRPYMRARLYLAQTLIQAKRLDEAVAEFEAMLELNPNDNQGLRYDLLGLYLETDNLAGVNRLLDEYDEEASAVFAWSAVLERVIAGDTTGAEDELAIARETNPFVESYLLGEARLPMSPPEYCGFGDNNEAVICVFTLANAWTKHPQAMQWLHEHRLPQVILPTTSVGRNEPCPCGSGKKYKKCCMGRETPKPRLSIHPAASEMALRDLHEAMEGMEFSSEEEVNAFLEEYNRKLNLRHIEDFAGLSADQMHKLINAPFESPDIVEFRPILELEPKAPISALFVGLVETIGEKGLKPTARGNLPLKVVRDIALAYMGEEGYAEYTEMIKIYREEDYFDLQITRIVAEFAGLIRMFRGKFILSSKFRKLNKQGGMQAVYPVLLQAFAREFNWASSDCYPEVGFIQQAFAYTLFLLDRNGGQWRECTFYEDAFLRAFPMTLDEIDQFFMSTKEDTFRRTYSLRSLVRFAEFMGLVEIDTDADLWLDDVFKLRKRPLLDAAVRFKI